MYLNRKGFLAAALAAFMLSIAGNAAFAAGSKVHHHHDVKQMLGGSVKQQKDGHHEIDHKGKYTTSMETKGGKIVAMHVKHSEKGDIPVKKYKTHKKPPQVAQVAGGQLTLVDYPSSRLAQLTDMGLEYIGYSYVDDYGNEEIYWVLVDEVYDGDTGAVEYIPVA
jgi:hypothetical protein